MSSLYTRKKCSWITLNMILIALLVGCRITAPEAQSEAPVVTSVPDSPVVTSVPDATVTTAVPDSPGITGVPITTSIPDPDTNPEVLEEFGKFVVSPNTPADAVDWVYAMPFAFQLFPTHIETHDTGDGWQEVKIDLGIQNAEPMPVAVRFPGCGDTGYLSIQEAPQPYDSKFDYQHLALFGLPQYPLTNMPLPPGFRYCGYLGNPLEDRSQLTAIPLRIEGRIPQGMHLTYLGVDSYNSVELTETPDLGQCKPTGAETLPEMTVETPLGLESAPFALISIASIDRNHPPMPGVYSPEEPTTVVRLNIKNPDAFNELVVESLRVAIIDDDGIVRPMVGGEVNNPEGCQNFPVLSSGSVRYRIGPSQTITQNLCFNERPNEIAAVIIWNPEDSTQYVAFRP